MKARLTIFEFLMKLILRFDLEKLEELRFQKVIREFSMDHSGFFSEM